MPFFGFSYSLAIEKHQRIERLPLADGQRNFIALAAEIHILLIKAPRLIEQQLARRVARFAPLRRPGGHIDALAVDPQVIHPPAEIVALHGGHGFLHKIPLARLLVDLAQQLRRRAFAHAVDKIERHAVVGGLFDFNVALAVAFLRKIILNELPGILRVDVERHLKNVFAQ